MGTKIEWCEETWNPVTGCTKVSEGCRNCYAERMAKRLAGRFGYPERPDHFKVTLHFDRLAQPLRWDKPRKIFVCSMGDLFHEEVPDDHILRVFRIMGRANVERHKFLLLTKRPERMKEWIIEYVVDRDGNPDPFHNIWLGVSAEDQETADSRIPVLLRTPAAKRFVSCEPLLGEIDLDRGNYGSTGFWIDQLDWVIAGGESGPGARPPDPDWFRSLRDQCNTAGKPFFFKQWGGPQKKGWVIDEKLYSGRELDGKIWNQYPE